MNISLLIVVGLARGDYVQTANELSYYDVDYDGFNAMPESKLICSKVRRNRFRANTDV